MLAELVLLSSSLLNQKPAPIYADVWAGASGPYRFLVDTGAQTSLIDPKLASEIGLKPEFRTEIVTQHSARVLPGATARNLRIGDTPLPETEVVFHDLAHVRRFGIPIRGLLGINALRKLNFGLTARNGRLEVEGERPPGVAVPVYLIEGRIAIKARMGAEDLFFALDSGSNHAVLFRTPVAMAKTRPVSTVFATLDGARSVVPTSWTAPMTFGEGVRIGMLPAAIVERKGTEVDGLLPASAFETIYVDQRRGEAVLVAKPASAARN